MYTCKNCNSIFGHRQSLWKHEKKRCPRRKENVGVADETYNIQHDAALGQGLKEKRISSPDLAPPSALDSSGDDSKLSDESNDSDREVDAEEMLKTIKTDGRCQDMQDSEDDASEESDDIGSVNGDEECEPSPNMWRNLIEQECGDRKAVMQLLYTLYCFFKSSEGASYRKLIKDIEFAHKMKRLTESKSINYALEKNKDILVKDYDDDIRNLLHSTKVRRLVEIFYGFSSDKLMKKIDAAVNIRIAKDPRSRTLEDAVEDVFNHCNDEILDKIRTEKKKRGNGLYIAPWK